MENHNESRGCGSGLASIPPLLYYSRKKDAKTIEVDFGDRSEVRSTVSALVPSDMAVPWSTICPPSMEAFAVSTCTL